MKFSELKTEHKITALKWMIKGLNEKMSASVKVASYLQFDAWGRRGQPFTGEAIWETLTPTQKLHFDHMGECIAMLQDEIDALEKADEPVSHDTEIDNEVYDVGPE